MDKDTKVLLMAVVIILVALVSFNMSDLTGKASSTAAVSGIRITVEPASVTFAKNDAAKIVTVRASLGSNKVEDNLQLYNAQTNTRLGGKDLSLCRSSNCRQTDLQPSYQYSISANLKGGSYYFAAKQGANTVARSNTFYVN
jgi:hypothetical protein